MKSVFPKQVQFFKMKCSNQIHHFKEEVGHCLMLHSLKQLWGGSALSCCCPFPAAVLTPLSHQKREKFWLLHWLFPCGCSRKGNIRASLVLTELKGTLSKIPLSSSMKSSPGDAEKQHLVTAPQFFVLGCASTYVSWLWLPRDNISTWHSPGVHSNSSAHPKLWHAPLLRAEEREA